mmetsp:Transcript_27523/g.82446  ORF Transcript_27523/g.82446 Transcript_27523/m.82446 type:complete len:288 (+) Transcript_27523:3-866(+)
MQSVVTTRPTCQTCLKPTAKSKVGTPCLNDRESSEFVQASLSLPRRDDHNPLRNTGTARSNAPPRVTSLVSVSDRVPGVLITPPELPQSSTGRLSSGVPHARISPGGRRLYKTTLCKNFEAWGSCPYGNHCRFAHGRTDFSTPAAQAASLKRKTKPCWLMAKFGACRYGDRCAFLHAADVVIHGHDAVIAPSGLAPPPPLPDSRDSPKDFEKRDGLVGTTSTVSTRGSDLESPQIAVAAAALSRASETPSSTTGPSGKGLKVSQGSKVLPTMRCHPVKRMRLHAGAE